MAQSQQLELPLLLHCALERFVVPVVQLARDEASVRLALPERLIRVEEALERSRQVRQPPVPWQNGACFRQLACQRHVDFRGKVDEARHGVDLVDPGFRVLCVMSESLQNPRGNLGEGHQRPLG